jgi:S-DNA-T family DNA segregation ATPase FtsK/SpoIIIE
LIKANFPARISFATASQVDSRVILDMQGAETLLGDGDMLYLASDAGYPVRVQGCYVSPDELDRVIGFWRKAAGQVDDQTPWTGMLLPEEPERPGPPQLNAEYVDEDMLQRAISVVRKRGSASASLLQRRLHIGYPRAARLMEVLTEMDIIGPPVPGGQTREVLLGGEHQAGSDTSSEDPS